MYLTILEALTALTTTGLALFLVRNRVAANSRTATTDFPLVASYGLLAASVSLSVLSVGSVIRSLEPESKSTNTTVGYPIAPHSEATFSVLLGQENELRGYGLYSYLLFGSEPSDDTARERYIAALVSISSLPSTRKMLLSKFKRETLNITYVPLVRNVEINSRPTDQKTATALLNSYNYPRARALIDRINPALRGGPYIISVLEPLAEAETVPSKYLFQDLSSTSPKVVSSWVTIFQVEASKEEFWEPETASRFAADLRSVIDVVAHQIMPSMPSKIATWIGWQETSAAKKSE